MSATIDFFFDFSSSYSYVAVPRLTRLADQHGWDVRWKPIALGAIFKARGHLPPNPGDPKGAYIWRDVARCAAESGLEYNWPEPFPFNSIPAARVFYVLAKDDRQQAEAWARAVFSASFAEGRDCSDPAVLSDIAGSLGLDGQRLLEATKDDSIKQALKDVTAEAMDKGVFGAPTFIAGGEMYWGADRLDSLERHVTQ